MNYGSVIKKIHGLLKPDTASLDEEKASLSDFEAALDRHHIIAHRTRSKEADLFRFLRTQILQGMSKNNFKTIAISSPRYGDGKTTIASNLAVSIAQDLKQTVYWLIWICANHLLQNIWKSSQKSALPIILPATPVLKTALFTHPLSVLPCFLQASLSIVHRKRLAPRKCKNWRQNSKSDMMTV